MSNGARCLDICLLGRCTGSVKGRRRAPGGGVGTEMRVQAKMRYNHSPQEAVLRVTGEKGFEVEFAEAQTAITPGQACVCFEGDVVLGGGWIDSAE